MTDQRTRIYAEQLSELIQIPTVSVKHQTDFKEFFRFRKQLQQMFPCLFASGIYEEFEKGFLLRWRGKEEKEPILLMNHHDVVEAPGEWKYPPFAGQIAEGRVWGRGTLDTKSGLWAMLQAAEELQAEGFVPNRDIYFLSTCDEETDGTGAQLIASLLKQRGIRFSLVLDEGGMILSEPIDGAKGTYAMVGVGEKGCVDLKFIARSNGGHASAPEKNTPLVRLGKFMAQAEKGKIFPAKLSETVCEMFSRLSQTMSWPMKWLFRHARCLKPILERVMPRVSATANSMLKTTVAFTMASGSQGSNVLPQEAWVIGNMRYSHHQGAEQSIRAITKLAEKFDIQTQVLDPIFDSPVSDYQDASFALIEKAVAHVFPGTKTTPYLLTGASDSRYLSCVCNNCLRFLPIGIDQEQLDTIHGINENIPLSALAPAVDFYRYLLMEA